MHKGSSPLILKVYMDLLSVGRNEYFYGMAGDTNMVDIGFCRSAYHTMNGNEDSPCTSRALGMSRNIRGTAPILTLLDPLPVRLIKLTLI